MDSFCRGVIQLSKLKAFVGFLATMPHSACGTRQTSPHESDISTCRRNKLLMTNDTLLWPSDANIATGPSMTNVIMIVDDSEDTRELFKATLEAEGFAVVGASDGPQA